MRDKGGLGLIEHFSLIYLGKIRGEGRNLGRFLRGGGLVGWLYVEG